MHQRVAILAAIAMAAVAIGSPAWAQTDWTAVSAVWSRQLADLRRTQATVLLCKLPVDRAAAVALGQAERGLDRALGLSSRQRREARKTAFVEVARTAGAMASPCAPDSPLVMETASALKAVAARLAAQGTVTAQAPAEPGPAPDAVIVPAQPAPTGVAPPSIPDISLIRNCRAAVVKRLGTEQAAQNDVFWPQYEACMAKQGVGWF